MLSLDGLVLCTMHCIPGDIEKVWLSAPRGAIWIRRSEGELSLCEEGEYGDEGKTDELLTRAPVNAFLINAMLGASDSSRKIIEKDSDIPQGNVSPTSLWVYPSGETVCHPA